MRADCSHTSVVIVLHNSGDTVGACVEALPSECEVILVDNASTDDGIGAALARRRDARIRKQANTGFGAGCNSGAALATRDVLLFLNPDAAIKPQALARLQDEARRRPDWLIGPAIAGPDGAVQATCRRPSRVSVDVAESLPAYWRWAPARLRRDVPEDAEIYRDGGPVGYVQGACMAVLRGSFEAAGGFDETFFLYGEEETLAARLRARGGGCYYLPQATAGHIGGTSTAKAAGFSLFHLYRSKILLYGKRDGVGRARAARVAISAALGINSVVLRAATRGRRPTAWMRTAVAGMSDGVRTLENSRAADA